MANTATVEAKVLLEELPTDLRSELPPSQKESEEIVDEFNSSFGGPYSPEGDNRSSSTQSSPGLNAGDVSIPDVDKLMEPVAPVPAAPKIASLRQYTPGAKAAALLPNVSYIADENWKHQMDIYLPEEPQGAPIMFHVHGGGWSRGDRTHVFYGAPGFSNGYAAMGFITVAMSYRLGAFPHFMHDVAQCIAFTLAHIRQLHERLATADITRIYLSGHSAGGHIVSLLLTDPQYLEAVGVDASLIQCAVFASAIYTLRNPFSANFDTWKNWGFKKLYLDKAFPESALDSASPAWRVVHKCLPDEDLIQFCKETTKLPSNCCGKVEPITGSIRNLVSISGKMRVLDIPIFVLSADCDLGLEHDSDRWFSMMHKLNPRAVRATIPKTSHPSICKADQTFEYLAPQLKKVYDELS
jgi:acetyl esterase/lipase